MFLERSSRGDVSNAAQTWRWRLDTRDVDCHRDLAQTGAMGKRKPTSKRPSEALVAELRTIFEADVLSEAAEALAAGSTWAHAVLAGQQDPPPDDLDPGVPEALVAILFDRSEATTLGWLAGLRRPPILAKAARRAAHRLRSAGVEVSIKPATPTPRVLADTPSEAHLSFVSQYDDRGQRIIWIAEPQPRGLGLYRARTCWRRGLLELESGTASRSDYRRVLRDLERRDLLTARCDTPTATWLVQEAARRTKALGRALPRGYLRATRSLTSVSDIPHPGIAVTPVSDEILGIYDRPELLLGWIADEETLKRINRAIQDLVESPILIDALQRRERATELLGEEASRFFQDESHRASSRGFLLDMAHLLHLRGDPDAGRLRAAADLFRIDDVHTHAFARQFLLHRFDMNKIVSASPSSVSSDGDADSAPAKSPLVVP